MIKATQQTYNKLKANYPKAMKDFTGIIIPKVMQKARLWRHPQITRSVRLFFHRDIVIFSSLVPFD